MPTCRLLKIFTSAFSLASLSLNSATFIVNSTADTNTGVGMTGTLRYCLLNFSTTDTINFTGIPGGSTITLTSSLPQLDTGQSVTIVGLTNGSGAPDVTIDGANLYRAFSMMNSGSFSISNLNIQNTQSLGANGGDATGGGGGGGGAAGEGGGLGVNNVNNLSLTNVIFSSNNATGGNGGNAAGAGTASSGGGGGGGGGSFTTGLGTSGAGGAGVAGTGNSGGGGGGGGGGGNNALAGNLGVGQTGGAGGSGGSNAGGAGGTGVLNAGGGGGGAGGDASGSGNPGDNGNANGQGGNGGISSGSSGGAAGTGGGGGGGTGTGTSVGGNGGDVNTNTLSSGGGAGGGGSGPTMGGLGGLYGIGGGGGGGGGSPVTGGAGGGANLAASSPGFGGGQGGDGGSGTANGGGGGGGAGLGGAIYWCRSGNLTINDDVIFNNNTVSSGSGGSSVGGGGAQPGSAGLALAPDIFIYNSTITFNINTTSSLPTPIESPPDVISSFVKNGPGTLILNGTTSFPMFGGGSVTAGTLQAGNANAFSSLLSWFVSSGTFDLNGFDQTISSIFTLPGTFVTLGAGTLTVTGADMMDSTITGSISGSGGIIKQGAFILNLSGTSTYSGTTQVTDGTFQAGANNAFSSASAIILSNTATLDLNSFNETIPSLTGDTGTFVTLGSGTLTTGSSNASTTYAGSISGMGGGVTKVGTGTFILTGASTYTGATTVDNGTLLVDGSILGTATVNAPGILGGTGSVNDLINNGTVAPGDSIGTLNVTGNYTQNSGSILSNEIDNAGNTDLLNVTGTVTINPGSTLQVVALSSSFPTNFLYTIVQGSSVTGTFSNVTYVLPPRLLLQAQVIYNAANIQFQILSSSFIAFSDLITGGNAGAVAVCLDQVPLGNPDFDSVLNALNGISNLTDLRNALNQLQPSQFTALALVQESNDIRVRTAFTHRLQELYTATCSPRWHGDKYNPDDYEQGEEYEDPEWSKHQLANVWIEPFYDRANQHNSHSQPGYHDRGSGVAIGTDFRVVHNFYVGAGFAYTYSHINWKESQGHGRLNNYYGALYTTWRPKWFYIDASFIGSSNHYEASRNIRFPGVNRKAKNHHQGYELAGQLGVGGLLNFKPIEIQPFGRADYIFVHENGYKEHGAKSLDLRIKDKNSNLWRTELGSYLSSCIRMHDFKMIPSLYASWIREMRDEGTHIKAQFIGSSCTFRVSGLNPDRSLLGIGASTIFLLSDDRVSLGVFYDGQISSNYWEYQFSGRLGANF